MIAVCFPHDSEEPKGFCEEWVLPNGDIIQEHPRSLLDDETFQIMEAYMHYKNGFLPVTGGLLDQSNKFNECMSVVQQWVNKNVAA